MHFCDETSITCNAGNGGNGAISFRREKFVAKGGPDGGSGGHGGDVILKSTPHLNTLVHLHAKKQFDAPAGEKGSKKNCAGMNGEPLILEVPVGTMVRSVEEKEEGKGAASPARAGSALLADLSTPGDEYVVAKGGMGGKGNSQFISSTRQAPAFAELGEPGESVTVKLELSLVADIAIIGLPSAGKSTLISRISAARPKIADYPFTTLIPNLGVVDLKQFGGKAGTGFTVVDTPGLIEGAAEGRGLGHAFLRHISRAEILIHLIDGSLDDLHGNFTVINKELKKYSPVLAKKEQVVVINKADLLIPEIYPEITDAFKTQHKKKSLFFISAATGVGLKELVFYLYTRVRKLHLKSKAKKVEKEPEETYKIFHPHLQNETHVEITRIGEEKVKTVLEENMRRMTHRDRFEKKKLRGKLKEGQIAEDEFDDTMYALKHGFKKEDKVRYATRNIFEVKGKRIEQIVVMTDMSNLEAIDRVHDVMHKQDVTLKLQRAGAKIGDAIMIHGRKFIFRSSR